MNKNTEDFRRQPLSFANDESLFPDTKISRVDQNGGAPKERGLRTGAPVRNKSPAHCFMIFLFLFWPDKFHFALVKANNDADETFFFLLFQ